MVSKNELKIGNWLYDQNYTLFQVSSIIENGVDYDTEFGGEIHMYECNLYENLQPVPITEEWLLKFGAKIVLVKEIKYFVINGLSFLHNGVDGYYMGLGKGFSVYVGYVHKLQNIYYEIRGKELTLSVT